MSYVNHLGKEINCKIVYYGPGLCGKTTNLNWMFSALSDDAKGKMISLATDTDRTLFYDASRKLVLRGSDGIIFVADSQPSRREANVESLENLETNLGQMGQALAKVPYVLQYNKRDVAEVMTIDELQDDLNPLGVPYVEAAAVSGQGVFETLKVLSRGVLTNLSKQQ
jgi:GTPase SAR1 family protein